HAMFEGFDDGTVDALGRNTAKLHLEGCGECSAEVADLRESLAPMRSASRQQVERHTTRDIASSPPFGLSVPMRIAAMVAMIAFAAIALVVVWRWSSTGPAQPNNGR